jgi:hypothetical protein
LRGEEKKDVKQTKIGKREKNKEAHKKRRSQHSLRNRTSPPYSTGEQKRAREQTKKE